jgi:chemotaxis protein histidine kinase CheA
MGRWSYSGGGRGDAHKLGLPEERKALVERYMIDAEEAELRSNRAAAEQAQREAAEERTRPAAEEGEQTRRATDEEARLAAERQARRAAEEQARREAEEQARREAEQKAQREAEQKAQREAEQKAQREAEQKAQREAEQKAQREAAEAQPRPAAATEQAQRDSMKEAAAQAAIERKQGGAPMNSYLRAAVRMWWLVLIGVVAAGFVAVHIAKKHKPPTYAASTQLMVDSTALPFLRTGITQTQQASGGRVQVRKVPGTGATVTTTTPAQPAQSTQEQPNTQILVQAANLYPLLVTSDAVTALRTKLYGNIPGTVTAQALYSNNGAVRYTMSQFPIIQINSVSKSSTDATKLANTTALTLRRWVMKDQRGAHVPRSQRIVLRPLVMSKVAVEQKHTRLGFALLVGVGVLALFYALAVVLDWLLPSKRRKEQTVQTPDNPETAEGHAPAVPPAEA